VATAQEGQAGATDFSWSGNYGGPQRTNAMSGTVPIADTVRWSLSAPATKPAIADGVAYAGNGSQLVAVDAATGRGMWSYTAGSQLTRQPAVGADVVVGISADNELIAVERDAGVERWRITLPSEPGAPTISDGTVYIGTAGRLRAIGLGDGTTEWTYDATEDVSIDEVYRFPTAAVDEYVVVNFITDNLGFPQSTLTALQPDSGELAWEIEFEEGRTYPPAIFDGMVYANTSGDSGKTVAVSGATGTQQWTYAASDISTSPAVNADLVVLSPEDISEHAVVALDRQSGEELWTNEFSGGVAPTVALDDEYVYLWADNGTIAQARAADGLLEFEYETEYDNADTDFTLVPTPYGLFAYHGKLELLGEEGAAVQNGQTDQTQSDGDETATTMTPERSSNDPTTPAQPSVVGGSRARDRGFFTNDDDLFTNFSAREWTILGAVISVAGVVVQAWIGD
jgi:outer membrane protein assembly factor BamB